MTKRISFADLIRSITEQGWALLTPENELQDIDHKSPILVRSPGGYEQRRPAGAFAPGQLPVSCSYDRRLRKGETMAVLTAAALLDTRFLREYTPDCLKPYRYRLDGWAEFDHPAALHVRLALEHQGDHRNNPKAPLHAHRGGPEVSMARQAERDAHVASLLREDGVHLALVPDLLAKATTWTGVIGTVADALEAALPFLRDDAGYRLRKARYLSGELTLAIPASWREHEEQRIRLALETQPGEGGVLTFVRCDPLGRIVTLRCARHGELEPANINNVLGSVDGTNPGTRCPKCANELQGASRRLTPQEIVAAAEAAGFRALFDLGTYENNQQPLRWQCLKNESHEVVDSLAHLTERGCPLCRAQASAVSRRQGEFEEIRGLVDKRGDTLLSTSEDYVDQLSGIRFKCGLCGKETTQKAVKIKLGQRHECQRLSSSIATRRAIELQHLKANVAILGIEVLTLPEDYRGNRSPVEYRVRGEIVTRQAAPYLLRRWARQGRIPSR